MLCPYYNIVVYKNSLEIAGDRARATFSIYTSFIISENN
ncbi:hypothetical protein NIES2100_42860 [Calothrix sp. NIES-2100]|nr:hypothetical protein NIES2100_42860 [Calothrix sp. NIES-2100]